MAGLREYGIGQPHPAVGDREGRVVPGAGLRDDTAVADVDESVGDRGGVRVVADDQRCRAGSAHELVEEPVDRGCVVGVELAGGFVGEQQPGSVRDRGADGDALLLAARERAGPVVGAIGEPDLLEEIVGCAPGLTRVMPE